MEIIRKGIPVSNGYAIGKALVMGMEEFHIPRKRVSEGEVELEVSRLGKASASAKKEFESQLNKLSRKGAGIAQILRAHLGMIADPKLHDEVVLGIRKSRFSAPYAVSRVFRKKIKTLEATGSPYFVSVIRDLAQIEKTLLRHLLGKKSNPTEKRDDSFLLIAPDLSPSETLLLDREKLLGLITEVGGPTSHTAIVASSLGIPAVVGVEDIATDIDSGDTVILDGMSGTVILNPSEGTLKRYQAMERNFVVLEERLALEVRDLPAETIDGHRIEINANIEMTEEIPTALKLGAEGIGLYRTEFLYLQRDTTPTEFQHMDAYHSAITKLGQRKLTLRTLDLGMDKIPIQGQAAESNPLMGTRALRYCLENPEIFRTQLRAILKVAHLGNVEIMVPMVSTVEEIRQVREFIHEVEDELRREGEKISEKIPVGIMVEIPSTAVIADIMADYADFFSIGTNDLIAYSMAVDRLNERLASLYQPAHPAILRLLKHVIEVGEKKNKPVAVCGEMSSDIQYTILLLGMGLKTFSVVPPAIPEIKKVIRSVTMQDAQAIAKRAFEFEDAEKTLNFLREETRKIIPDVL